MALARVRTSRYWERLPPALVPISTPSTYSSTSKIPSPEVAVPVTVNGRLSICPWLMLKVWMAGPPVT